MYHTTVEQPTSLLCLKKEINENLSTIGQSLTSVPCKIMEHIIFKHIMEHLETHNILADFQHGFREKRSCETQLIITVEEISRYLDNKQHVDMSKNMVFEPFLITIEN